MISRPAAPQGGPSLSLRRADSSGQCEPEPRLIGTEFDFPASACKILRHSCRDFPGRARVVAFVRGPSRSPRHRSSRSTNEHPLTRYTRGTGSMSPGRTRAFVFYANHCRLRTEVRPADPDAPPGPSAGARSREHSHHAGGGRRVRAAGDAVLHRQGFVRPAAAGAEGVSIPGRSRSRCSTSTPPTSSAR